jgi:chitin deacetylase
MRQQNPDSKTSDVKALVALRDEAYKKAIFRLAEAERIRLQNIPLPVQFQGKTIRDVKPNSEDTAIAQPISAKSLAPDAATKAIAQSQEPKPIALTFDDGPWANSTSQVLNILKKNKIKATFFVVGRQVQTYPQLTKQIIADGHAIANHSWSHQYHQFNQSGAVREIDGTTELIYKTTGVKTALFRPPGGVMNNGLVSYAHQKKYGVIMWSADSLDWRYRNTTGVVDRVLREAKPGGIVLMHDGGGNRHATVQALPIVISQLKKRGYYFVTVPELLERADKQVVASKP